MKIMELYKSATKLKLRFISTRGALTVEQLWDLPLASKTKVSLNDVAITVSKELKPTDDFVGLTDTDANNVAELKMAIIKDIIEEKKAEIKAKADAAKKAEELKLINKLINEKEYQAVSNASLEELKAKRAALEGK